MFKYAVPPHVPAASYLITSPSSSSSTNSSSVGDVDENVGVRQRRNPTAASQGGAYNPQLELEMFAGNYSIIGGRSEWLEFMREAPLYWTVLGIPVTFERLTQFVLGTAVSLLAATLPRLFSKMG